MQHTMDFLPEDAPAPRLCHLIKWPDFDGYGFNLHAERSNPGQFIGKIDEDSPAQMAGLREGDRIVEVNGVNISNENHRQVVERIKSDPEQTRLLVVDAEADAWYKSQDLVVKSSQLNIIYSKTPIPRPAADSPRAKFHAQASDGAPLSPGSVASNENIISGSNTNNVSLDTTSADDFTNDEDSIEAASAGNGQLQIRQQQSQVKRISPAPMSPDSGRGDEEPPVLTVAAEINRQSPIRQQIVGLSDAKTAIKLGKEAEDEEDERRRGSEEEETSSSNQVEPDSLSQPASALSTLQQPEKQEQQVENEKQSGKGQEEREEDGQESTIDDETCKMRNGSAVDSGQSSSPDTSSSRRSSRSGSILDSLEQDQQQVDKVSGDKQPLAAAVDEGADQTQTDAPRFNEDDEALTTIKNHLQQQPAAINKSSESNNNNVNIINNNINNDGDEKDNQSKQSMGASTPTESISGEPQANKQPALRPALVNNDNVNVDEATENKNNNDDANEVVGDSVQMLKMQQQPQKASPNNNNLSGLNLNMTASEMRELIARRKKFDPKKAQMNIRQKYEIIQQM